MVSRATLADVARPLVLAAAFTSTWTGLAIGGLQPVDLFLLAAVPLLLLDAITSRTHPVLPRWVWIASLAVVAVAVVHIFFPTTSSYVNGRFHLLGSEALAFDGTVTAPLETAGKWLVALALVPVIVSYLAQKDRRILTQVPIAWMLGAAVSGLLAVTDFMGVTGFGPLLQGYLNNSGRQSGLASHPVNLGVACAIAIPVALYLYTRHKFWGMSALLFLFLGAFLSGSRGAQVASVAVIILTLLVARATRKIVSRLVLLIVVAGFLLVTFAPAVLANALGLFRFIDPSTGASASDLGRSKLAEQAMQDLAHNPILGVGLEIITHAHSVPLQLLAAGGLVLFLGMAAFWWGAIRAGWINRKVEPLIAGPLLVAVLMWLGLGIIENQLVDRYLYFPAAVLAALHMLQLRDRQSEGYPAEPAADLAKPIVVVSAG